jgi:hypothetical protein
MKTETLQAIRTARSTLIAAERLSRRLGLSKSLSYKPWQNPAVVRTHRMAYKAMRTEYRGHNLYYKRQLLQAALGVDGLTILTQPDLWDVWDV